MNMANFLKVLELGVFVVAAWHIVHYLYVKTKRFVKVGGLFQKKAFVEYYRDICTNTAFLGTGVGVMFGWNGESIAAYVMAAVNAAMFLAMGAVLSNILDGFDSKANEVKATPSARKGKPAMKRHLSKKAKRKRGKHRRASKK